MPQPSNLIPVYLTREDWNQVLIELGHSLHRAKMSEAYHLWDEVIILIDNIERQTAL